MYICKQIASLYTDLNLHKLSKLTNWYLVAHNIIKSENINKIKHYT